MSAPSDEENARATRPVYWKKWAAKNKYEELKEGNWLEPAVALLRKKTEEDWTEKHQNVARKLALDGGWGAEETLRNWLVGCKPVSSLPQGGRHRKAQALPLPRMLSQTLDPRSFQEAKSEDLKEGVEVTKRYCDAL